MEKITIQTTVLAPKTKTWGYYTNPKHIVNWNFASEDWCCPKAENDLQIGGKYLARMEAKDGSFGFDFEAIYTSITPEKSIEYKLADGRVVTIEFLDVDDQTEVHIAFDPETQNPIKMQRDGWQAILDNFKTYVEQIE